MSSLPPPSDVIASIGNIAQGAAAAIASVPSNVAGIVSKGAQIVSGAVSGIEQVAAPVVNQIVQNPSIATFIPPVAAVQEVNTLQNVIPQVSQMLSSLPQNVPSAFKSVNVATPLSIPEGLVTDTLSAVVSGKPQNIPFYNVANDIFGKEAIGQDAIGGDTGGATYRIDSSGNKYYDNPILHTIGKVYEDTNQALAPYTTDALGIGRKLSSLPPVDLTVTKNGVTYGQPITDVVNFGKGFAESAYTHPLDIAATFEGGEALGIGEGLLRGVIAKGAESSVPVFSTVARAASTPLAGDVGKLINWGLLGSFGAETAGNILSQPTAEGKGQAAGRAVLQLGGFLTGGSNVPSSEPPNIYAGKTFFGKVPAEGPITKASNSAIIKLGQAELYLRGLPEEAAALGDAFKVHSVTKFIQPFDPTATQDLLKLTDVTKIHSDVLNDILKTEPHSLFGSGMQRAQSVPESLMGGELGATPSSDVDLFTNVKSFMGKLADIPGAIVRSKDVPAVGGGTEKAVNKVIFGGYKFAVDPHDIPLDYVRLPGEVKPRVADSNYNKQWNDLLAFKLGDPFYVTPKSWQLTKPGDVGYKDFKVYEHSDVQDYRLMDALRKNLLTAKSEEFDVARGSRFPKDTIRLIGRFQDALQTERLKTNNYKDLPSSLRNKYLSAEKSLDKLKGRVIQYRPDVNSPIEEVSIGDLASIAQENLENGLSVTGKKIPNIPKVDVPIKSLEDYIYKPLTTAERIAKWKGDSKSLIPTEDEDLINVNVGGSEQEKPPSTPSAFGIKIPSVLLSKVPSTTGSSPPTSTPGSGSPEPIYKGSPPSEVTTPSTPPSTTPSSPSPSPPTPSPTPSTPSPIIPYIPTGSPTPNVSFGGGSIPAQQKKKKYKGHLETISLGALIVNDDKGMKIGYTPDSTPLFDSVKRKIPGKGATLGFKPNETPLFKPRSPHTPGSLGIKVNDRDIFNSGSTTRLSKKPLNRLPTNYIPINNNVPKPRSQVVPMGLKSTVPKNNLPTGQIMAPLRKGRRKGLSSDLGSSYV